MLPAQLEKRIDPILKEIMMFNKEEFEERRKTLKATYDRRLDAHATKFSGNIGSENAYLESCRELYKMYDDLAEVSTLLGDPIARRL